MNHAMLNKYLENKLFIRIVLIPALLVLVYLHLFMPDRYESTALVSVKDTGATQIQTGVLESLGVQANNSSEDQNLLQAYMGSKALALTLDKKLNLKAHYADSWDFLFGIAENDSLEKFHSFFKKHVRVSTDTETGLLAIHIQAYNAEFAELLASELLKHSEAFINDTGKKIAESEMAFALSEIERSQSKLKLAKTALLNFQDKHNLVSPSSEGESLLTIIYELEAESAAAEAELSQQRTFLNAEAPQIKALESKVDALKNEIESQKRRIIGGQVEKGKLNTLTSQYQNLLLDVELATTLYSSALNAYELARVQAGKQLKYLVVAAEPQLAEEALYPERGYWFLTMLVIFILLYAVGRLALSVVVEHRD